MAEMSAAHRAASLQNLKLAALASQARVTGCWKCAECGKEARATVHQKRQTYCSKECMSAAYKRRMSGSANPRFKNASEKTCEQCGSIYHSYEKQRRFCSRACNIAWSFPLRTSAKKDSNHARVVELLEVAGAKVMDLSRAMFGVPDLLVWHAGELQLVEVKNPKTSYGRRGLSPAQQRWCKEWAGYPIFVVRTDEDVAKFLDGTLPRVEVQA